MVSTELLQQHEFRAAELREEAAQQRQLSWLRHRRATVRRARWLDRLAVALAAVSKWSGSISSTLHRRAVARRRATAHT